MRRWWPVLIIVVLVVLFATLTAYLTSRRRSFDPVADHASFRTNPWGTKALRELCERNGLPTEEYTRPWDEFDAAPETILCVFDLTSAPDEQEIAPLFEWVRQGGHLVFAADALTLIGSEEEYSYSHPNHILLERLGLSAERGGPISEIVAVRSPDGSPVAHEVTKLLVNSPYRLVAADSAAGIAEYPESVTDGEEKIPEVIPVKIQETVPLLVDEVGVLVMQLTLDKGTVTVIADADILGNGQLAEADNAILAMNLIYSRGRPAAVYFDEYHHGRVSRPYAGERLPGAAVFAGLWGVLLCLAIYLTGSFWRFGRPVPLPREPRRSLTEHIQAFAGLYQGARATGAAVALIAQRFRSRLAELTAMGPAASPEELAAACTRTADVDTQALANLLTELSSIDPDTRLSETAMLQLARQIAHFEEAIFGDGKLYSPNP